MNQENYEAPEFKKNAFHCPHCQTYAHQKWSPVTIFQYHVEDCLVSQCSRCEGNSYWVKEALVYPRQLSALHATGDMPESVKEYYDEAREVSVISARSAAALLRIAAKKLCEHLGEDQPNLNRAIGNLHKKGLPENVIKSLHTLRIVGNEGGAHEGQIDLTGEDNEQIVNKLFWLINFIVEKTITEPAEIDSTFRSLPEDKRKAIEDKDNNKE